MKLYFDHILSFHVWMVDAHEFMDFYMGGSLPRETKNDFTARCVEYGLVEEQGGSSKHQTTVLFWSILCHRGSGPPEIERKEAFLIEEV